MAGRNDPPLTFKRWSEAQALEHRRLLGLSPSAPLPGRVLARHLGVTIIGPADIPGISKEMLQHLLVEDASSWSACTVFWQDVPTIILNGSHQPPRQESNIMHELAHIICGHSVEKIALLGNCPLRDYDKAKESEATWLGACLQLPRSALVWALARRMSTPQMSEHFVASDQLLQFRKNVTGLAPQFRSLG